MFQLLYQMVRILPSILGCEGKNGEHGPLLPAKNSYLTALEFLTNKSVFTDYCYRLLRLQTKENKIYDFSITAVLTNPGIIVYSWQHAVAVFNNKIDCHGTWLSMNQADNCSEFQWYIELK